MNARIVIFCLVAVALIAFPAYAFLDERLSGGIRDRGAYVEVNLQAMSGFNFDQDHGTLADVPGKWRALNGRKVFLMGKVAPGNSSVSEAANFDLVYSISKCCLGNTLQIQHFVRSYVGPTTRVEASAGPVRVLGMLHVKVEHENGKVSRVFTLDVDRVSPL